MCKRLFCKHKTMTCITNIYGDCINYYGCRSIWECKRCGKRFRSDKLEPSCEVINFKLGKE